MREEMEGQAQNAVFQVETLARKLANAEAQARRCEQEARELKA
jgi:hypothetical protein